MRRGSAQPERKDADLCLFRVVRIVAHGNCGSAKPDALPVHFRRLAVLFERGERVSEPDMRRRIAGIQLDRLAVLLGRLLVEARHCQRRAVPRAERHVLEAAEQRVPVALHGPCPVGAADNGQRMPHAGARRHVAGIDGHCPFVPLDGLLRATRLHQEVAHAEKGQDVARALLCRLPVGRLRLVRPAEARKGVGPAHPDCRTVDVDVYVARAALGAPALQNPVADLEGLLGCPPRVAGAAGRLHYGRLDEQCHHHVDWTAVHGRPHGQPDDPHGLFLFDLIRGQGMGQVVPHAEHADNLLLVLCQEPLEGLEIAFFGHPAERLKVLKPPHEGHNAGPAHPDVPALALDPHDHVGRAALPPLVEELLEDQP